tara:strand:+ start:623 stop:1909 length:1287 start_codon:yes stop_codon:yes gene_type:complete
MQTTNHHSSQTIAHGLASLGRYGDTYIVHAAEGETVIPAEILQANPRLRADLFRQMQMMGIKDPNRYVVGNTLNSLNPVTGQPEFWYKRILKVAKSILPTLGAIVGNRIAPGVGGIIGTTLGAKARGDSWKDSLTSGALNYITDVGIGAARRPDGTSFFEGLKTSAARPFQSAKAMFTDWGGPENPLAQGFLGSFVAPAGAEQFNKLNYQDQFYPQYRTAEDMDLRRAKRADFWTNQEELDLSRPENSVDASSFDNPFSKQPPTSFFQQPFLYEAGIPLLGAALLGEEEGPEGEISAGEAREIGDPEYADYLRYRSAPPGSEREQARRSAGITPSISAERLAESTGITLQQAQAYLESMYGEDANWRNLAGGGEIMGPGTGTSDSIPARLSDGEFVMTADAVRGAGNGNRDMGAARMYDLMSQFEGAR